MISSTTVFPYFQTGTPAADEFHNAVQDFGKAANIGVAMAQGWTTGKLMEKAGAALPEPPTTEPSFRACGASRTTPSAASPNRSPSTRAQATLGQLVSSEAADDSAAMTA